MRIFLESIDRGVLHAIVNGSYIPKVVADGKEVEKDFNSWIH